MTTAKTRYRFVHRVTNERGRDVLVWESVARVPGDSRTEQVRCYADFFWQRDP